MPEKDCGLCEELEAKCGAVYTRPKYQEGILRLACEALDTLIALNSGSSGGDTSILQELRLLNGATLMEVDDVGGGVTYQGWADPGSTTADTVWRVRRIVKTGDNYSIAFANSTRGFTNVWDDRLTDVYG